MEQVQLLKVKQARLDLLVLVALLEQMVKQDLMDLQAQKDLLDHKEPLD
jgi:hypothetical protein